MIILDNNILVEIERGNKELSNKILKLKESNPENPAITSAVYAEFLFGFLVIGKGEKAEGHLSGFDILNFDKASARKFAELRKELEDKGTPIPAFDLITASCAIVNDATLITLDKHFEKIRELKLVLFDT